MSHLHQRSGFGFSEDDLPSGLWTSAHWVWGRRATAKEHGFPFSEETVTETILLDLAADYGDIIKIVPFTKPEEGKTGADWEWCLYDAPKHRYLRFLMQAKVLDDQDKQYAHIDRYIGNSDNRQIDRLAEVSSSRGVPALYAFYNHLTDSSRVPTDHCPCWGCDECWGVSVAPLEAVRAALPDKKFETLKAVSIPWLCLLCAANGRGPGADPIDGALRGLRRLHEMSLQRYPDADRDDRPAIPDGPERDPPAYLQPILSTLIGDDQGGPANGGRVRDKLARENPGLAGVVLIDAAAAAEVAEPDGDMPL